MAHSGSLFLDAIRTSSGGNAEELYSIPWSLDFGANGNRRNLPHGPRAAGNPVAQVAEIVERIQVDVLRTAERRGVEGHR